MEKIRIHEDQENRAFDGRQKQSVMAGGQKRAVLGVINQNKAFSNVQGLKGKQPLGLANQNVPQKTFNDDKQCLKENRKNLVNPIVPVAQFEAFKVYEDISCEERYARIEQKLKAKSTSTIYKGTAEDRFYTKTEVAEMEKMKIMERLAENKEKEVVQVDQPMSIEKTFNESMQLAEDIIYKNNRDKDQFFELEEYRSDIYKYLREHEMRNRAKSSYMKKQPDITSLMRSILVDWLVEVSEEYKLQTETLYLTVNYIDRFLSYMSVVKGKLQLVGTSAMFLAAKYEEIFPPDISEFVYITDDTYNKRQVIRMEHLMLKVLKFDLSVPTPLTFITAICATNRITEKTMYLAMYLCELSLLNGETYLEFLSSTLAAASIAIAKHTLEQSAWDDELTETTGYELQQLKPCIEFLMSMFELAPTHPQHAIQDKYKSSKYMHVSQLTPSETPMFK